jgi:hypothetical protein
LIDVIYGFFFRKAKSTWDKLRKERDFHRMHHRRVVQEKNLLLVDMKRIKKHAASFEPALAALTERYDKLMREKTMVRLEKDKLSGKVDSLTQQLKTLEELNNAAAATEKKEEVPKTTIKKKSKESEWPADRANPFLNVNFEPTPATTFNLQKTFKGHAQAISGMALHPRKPILATVSDDASWKMWSIPTGDLIMSGDGHKDWVSSCDFNPKGTALATGSGDGTVKVWDFVNACCAATFGDHTQAVWGVAYHDSGDFLVSCSMDHSAKLWDLTSQKCRQSMRGHVDSVNSVCFQPFSNYLCTGSGDKTVSMWDMRTALCVQTFYGHRNAVNHVAFSLQGDTIVSSDADGIIKVWDVRMVAERFQIDAGTIGSSGVRHAANAASIDRSGKVLASASNGFVFFISHLWLYRIRSTDFLCVGCVLCSGPVRLYSLDSGEHLGDLQGHDAAVQAVLFDPQGKFIVSAGADNTFRVWS